MDERRVVVGTVVAVPVVVPWLALRSAAVAVAATGRIWGTGLRRPPGFRLRLSG